MSLIYRISGLNEFEITFEEYCVPCKFQRRCRYGKSSPLTISIDCKDLLRAYEKERYEQMREAQKQADIEDTYEQIESRIKVNTRQIFSNIWKKKIKEHKEEILCLNSHKLDSMLTSQRGAIWWGEYAKIMKKIYQDCRKQTSLT
ncbi:MAG: hypothetical protein JW776_03670 [Candidatus Lokiarchaeota archaeon]|nr:hypothetical protein [Candidatus Lokiarchaeota archaeon]